MGVGLLVGIIRQPYSYNVGVKLSALLVAACVLAQTPAPPRLTFDVIAIHPSNPTATFGRIKPIPGNYGYTAENIPVRLMIALMYKVPGRQIEGGPSWLDTDRFDVEARADAPHSIDDLHTMYQNLLVDRFGLRFHHEVREGNIYALTIDPSGLKLKPNISPDDDKIPVNGGPARTTGVRVPMIYLTWLLSQILQNDGRPVVDETGLTGNYDFILSYRPILPPDAPADSLPPEERDLPTLFDALRTQLGLHLTATRGAVDHLVIDQVEKPTAN
ncbi:MAG TPA: TIGR03435 family protein [Acidobacteriaceae bacterium]|nr:TIGR03435 family protein [Acidobacteriaceae bacterium]